MSDTVEEVRSFNRFFTRSVGALDPDFLGTRMSLSEARVLYEIANGHRPLAFDIQSELGMNAAYVSRVVARFEKRGWITRERAAGDARRRPIALTDEGRAAFALLDDRQRADVMGKVDRLGSSDRSDLVTALRTVRRLLGAEKASGFTLRTFRPGDMGLIASRQAILYREANGWNEKLEVNVGESAFGFLRGFKPGREQGWVAEVDGRLAGSILATDEGGRLSRLRLLYVEPFARGRGIGDALVSVCVEFATAAGYEAMTLWTHTELESARRIYTGHRFRIVETEVHDRFGPTIQSETWWRDLQA